MSPNGLLSRFWCLNIFNRLISANRDADAKAAGHNGDHAGRNAGHNRAAGAEAVPDRSAGARNSADAADSGDDSGHNDDDRAQR